MFIKGVKIGPKHVAQMDALTRKGSISDCWEWTGYRDKHGYGRKRMYNKAFLAHRVAWAIDTLMDPKDMCVLHSCDNPACVNPAHLFLGDHNDNMEDMVTKGRSAKGERQGTTTLTEDEVIALRETYKQGGYSLSELAATYHVCYATAWNIVNRAFWRHV